MSKFKSFGRAIGAATRSTVDVIKTASVEGKKVTVEAYRGHVPAQVVDNKPAIKPADVIVGTAKAAGVAIGHTVGATVKGAIVTKDAAVDLGKGISEGFRSDDANEGVHVIEHEGVPMETMIAEELALQSRIDA